MPPPQKHPASPTTLLHDPRVLRLLTFLTRTQAWLTPPQIAKAFRVEGRPVGVATLYRWFAALEETAGLVYFPYPRMNLLGLQEVAVRVHGLRSPQVLSAVPFSHSFLVELGFDGQACISQDYWVPGAALKAFDWPANLDDLRRNAPRILALIECGGNKRAAARLLGKKHQSLSDALARIGL